MQHAWYELRTYEKEGNKGPIQKMLVANLVGRLLLLILNLFENALVLR